MKRIIIVFVAGLILGGVWVYNNHDKASIIKDNVAPSKAMETLQQEALKKAKSYKPTGICAQVTTPAQNEATGAKFTFPSSCLPPGWNKVAQ